ncbi:MAG: exodeoxyribonuclease VII small subunit [Gammaproteobacteria bacterium]|nr:exodeoxyribonuclease VII small subunit [Gammaproteobacteria bacterium]
MPKRKVVKPVESGKSADFEGSLAELEKLVTRLEGGEQTLEQSLEDFERGISLARSCQKDLKAAEQRVEKLIEKNGEFVTEPFAPED